MALRIYEDTRMYSSGHRKLFFSIKAIIPQRFCKFAIYWILSKEINI
jgi:hypothetical protein